ncbi:glycoside hydrolase family 3 N-terminal domain-containing protein [Glaciecola sp. 33A]|jgi:beta-glucosidase|uniref:glycoside hydrolase family 3 protein n=1 Tax=Glaciecola sp. 33A TaxID=2057807 RepID=UPI000C34B2C7|nr:glycoside hydrolase family 3 N-terminal domain-containing protein [Glaciecola sp. 33A]PKI03489.1 glycosyl hydrolase [Glaciecola sp. 33A]
MRTALILSVLLIIAGCTNLSTNKTQAEVDVICEWGTQKFDLCQFTSYDDMIEALIAEMTLDEKIGQMTQSVWHNNVSPEVIRDKNIGSIIHTEGPTPGPNAIDWVNKFDEFQSSALQTRLGIPLLIAVDAVHGQNTFEGAVIFPHNIGMAATRNLKLIKQAAQITASEVAGTGFNWTFSPCIAMPQHEHWGRVYEGFTEDRDLTTAAVIASVRGHQGSNLANRNTIAATAKHFIGDGATEGGVEGGNAIMTDELMRERYLPPYAGAVDQGVAAIMVGFNSYNGLNMHQHRHLVTDVLKNELGFQGVVLTDWNGGLRFGEPHKVINAGIDMAMQPGNHEEFMSKLKLSIIDQTVPMSRIDDAVQRILAMKFSLGLFSDPFAKRELSLSVGSKAHRAVARQAVRESLVLLKNDNQALPLDPFEPIAVVGTHANNSGLQSGGWSIHWQGQTHSYAGATTILEGINSVNSNVEYAEQGCYAGMQAQKAVVVVGENPYAEGAGDSDELWLSDEHKTLITGCKNLGKKVIVILISGRVLVINQDLNNSDAFVAAWLPGSEGGGIADFLFATDGFKPTGKSPYSWPVEFADIPIAPYAEHALFKFGYGLQDY